MCTTGLCAKTTQKTRHPISYLGSGLLLKTIPIRHMPVDFGDVAEVHAALPRYQSYMRRPHERTPQDPLRHLVAMNLRGLKKLDGVQDEGRDAEQGKAGAAQRDDPDRGP